MLIPVLAALALTGCDRAPVPNTTTTADADPAAAPGPDAGWFTEEADERGLRFTYASGHDGSAYRMPEIIGGGAALFDMDRDGDLDAYLIQGGADLDTSATASPGDPAPRNPPNRLFRNTGNGTFVDVTTGSGAGDTRYGMGVAAGDVNGDGHVDLFVTNVGRNTLLINDGSGVFTDGTEAAGLASDTGWSTSAAFLDADHDGDLDLWVCQYLEWSPEIELECFNTMGGEDYCSPRNYLAPAQDRLYRNDGDGTFTDVTDASGIASFSGTGLGIVAGDVDGDGRVDVFIANDGMRDQLWINETDTEASGPIRFIEKSVEYGCAFDRDGRAAAGMGVTAADIDDDGDLDVLVCNLRNESDSLLLNHDGAYFSHAAAPAGIAAISRAFTRFGMAWEDFDHDGVLDLYQANGRVMRQSDAFGQDRYAEPNLLFRGVRDAQRGTITFEEVTPRGGTDPLLAGTSRAAAFGDVDGDGDVDVLVVNKDGPAHLLINRAPRLTNPADPDADPADTRGNWMAFRITNENGAPAIGARLTCTVGGRTVTREVRSASSYLAANDPTIHIGLGEETEIGDVVVTWPDGEVREVEGPLDPNKVHPIPRGTPG